jgi:hypothetical protein
MGSWCYRSCMYLRRGSIQTGERGAGRTQQDIGTTTKYAGPAPGVVSSAYRATSAPALDIET